MTEFHIKQYQPTDKTVWDEFVKTSKNGTFLFLRDYMDYHADRFQDSSLMFYDENDKLTALLPANIKNDVLYSHQGLTYGGLILGSATCSTDVLLMFDVLCQYAQHKKWKELYYKVVPSIYHIIPAEEDEYALWRHGATLCSCNIASTVSMQSERCKPSSRKARYARSLEKQGFWIDEEASLSEFWRILESHLKEKYGATPVHTLAEIEQLQTNFPENIKCYLVRNAEGIAQAGAVAYISQQVFHLQYSAITPEGGTNHALSYLFYFFYTYCQKHPEFRFYDIGTSNEEGGHILNSSLEYWKWTFGGRGIAHKTYRLSFGDVKG